MNIFTFLKSVPLLLIALLPFGCKLDSLKTKINPVQSSTIRTYDFYDPNIKQYYIYKGANEPGKFAYNHCPSIEFFNGKFYAVWMANYKNDERLPNRYIRISTSSDFISWTPPLLLAEQTINNPFESTQKYAHQTQPLLLNYNNKELWCIWRFTGRLGGVHLSKLTPQSNDKWTDKEIAETLTINNELLLAYPSQNPFILKSGRVLLPVTFISETIVGKDKVKYNGVLYTDDGGDTWASSNGVSIPDEPTSQWEPCVHEQIDGKLRMFSRNMGKVEVPPTQWLLTTIGTGSKKTEPVVFEPDLKYSFVETANTRMQVIKLPTHRYLMFHHDTYSPRAYEGRTNGALFFSRTGFDDFIAGPGFTSSSKDIIAYPQGIEKDGVIYVAYTLWGGNADIPRSIQGAAIDPAPAADKFYIWPRDKDVVKLNFMTKPRKYWQRLNPDYKYVRPYKVTDDERTALVFEHRGTAGVEIDPVYFEKNQSLKLSFDVKILEIQEKGNLILCSFGDQIPIRIAIPSNRKDRLYAWTADQWQDAGPIPQNTWQHITITFSAQDFTIQIENNQPAKFKNPIDCPNPRLYLGDSYEIDAIESNRNSKFLIDLNSIKTQVK